jgi:hypothetical protein
MAPVALAPGTSGAGIFSNALTQLLATVQAQNAANTGPQGTLTQAQAALTNESVAPGGPVAFNPAFSADSQVGNQQTMQAAFQPAIAGVAAQAKASADQTNAITGEIGTINASPAMQKYTLSPGQTVVNADGTVVAGTDQYAPTGQVDANGVPTFYNVRTGQIAGSAQDPATSGSPVTPVASGTDTLGGVDWSTYATSPTDLSDVNSLYTQFKKTAVVPSAQGIDSTIQALVGGKAPVTGAMIMTAAATYGIDANMLAARIGQESVFGTSAVAKSDNNVTGMEYVAQSGVSQGSARPPEEGGYYAKYKTVAQSINALASWMQDHPDQSQGGTGTAPAPLTSTVGGQFSTVAAAKVQALPASMQQYADAGPLGVAYINDDRINKLIASTQTQIQLQADKEGIPTLSSADVANLKGVMNVFSQLTQMEQLAAQNLGSGILGRANDATVGAGAAIAQTPWGTNLKQFDGYRETAVNLVRGLAGGAGLRINGAEIAANVDNLPSSGDNVETAFADINTFIKQTMSVLQNTFPYASIPALPAGMKAGDTIPLKTGNAAGLPAGNYVVGFDGTLFPTQSQ